MHSVGIDKDDISLVIVHNYRYMYNKFVQYFVFLPGCC